jgi:hypothetical protein
MNFESITTLFSSMISEPAMNCVCWRFIIRKKLSFSWWFLNQQWMVFDDESRHHPWIESTITQFSLMISESVVNWVCWWFLASTVYLFLLMSLDWIVTQFSLMISDSIVNCVCWWFHMSAVNLFLLMIFDLTVTLMIFDQVGNCVSWQFHPPAMIHFHWWIFE